MIVSTQFGVDTWTLSKMPLYLVVRDVGRTARNSGRKWFRHVRVRAFP